MGSWNTSTFSRDIAHTASGDQEKCAGLPTHYLFGAIPVGDSG
jgi:hypothetical protein